MLIRKIKWLTDYFLEHAKRRLAEWVPTGALVKSLFVGFSAYIVIFTIAIFLFVEVSVDAVYGLVFGWAFRLFCF